jgi:hypothetical protein
MIYLLRNIFVLGCACLLIGCSLGDVSVTSTPMDITTVGSVPVATKFGQLSLELMTTSEVNSSDKTREYKKMQELKKCILHHWIHSHEEDTNEVVVYRPMNYSFPPSRGRIGFEFMEDGMMIYHGIAYTDGSEQSSGHWDIQEQNRIRINVENERIQSFYLEIVSCDEEKLKVKK